LQEQSQIEAAIFKE